MICKSHQQGYLSLCFVVIARSKQIIASNSTRQPKWSSCSSEVIAAAICLCRIWMVILSIDKVATPLLICPCALLAMPNLSTPESSWRGWPRMFETAIPIIVPGLLRMFSLNLWFYLTWSTYKKQLIFIISIVRIRIRYLRQETKLIFPWQKQRFNFKGIAERNNTADISKHEG